MRYARVTVKNVPSPSVAAAAVDAFLPENYKVIATDRGDDRSNGYCDTVVIVSGTDNAGWTLDDYVLPRLASGLIFGHEIAHAGATEPIS